MQNRSSNGVSPRNKQGQPDVNEIATRVFREAVGESVPNELRVKNQAAVELGRLGGLKGGNARAAKLSAGERSEIAKKAAATRWGKLHDA